MQLINLEDALNALNNAQVEFDEYYKGLGKAKAILQELPRIKPAEPQPAYWSHLGGDEWCCSNCGNVIATEGSWEKPTQKYCDECGAKMHLEVKEEY